MQNGELIEGSLAEPEVFAEIFERHYDSVLAYARRRVGWGPGEEVAAQTFVVAFERRARFDTSFTSARPWLLGIATNLIRHHLRDERVHLGAIRRVPTDGDVPSVEDPDRIDALRLRGTLVHALQGLSVADRETFLLVVLGELTYEEAARAIGVPIGTVRSRIHRARQTLREQIQALQAIQPRDDDGGDEMR